MNGTILKIVWIENPKKKKALKIIKTSKKKKLIRMNQMINHWNSQVDW